MSIFFTGLPFGVGEFRGAKDKHSNAAAASNCRVVVLLLPTQERLWNHMDAKYSPKGERIAAEASRRRTFAIISHPDAGKTTLTEQLLLLGGAIRLAGQVKARGEARRARSDWMKIEQERGISVTTAVMTFEYDG